MDWGMINSCFSHQMQNHGQATSFGSSMRGCGGPISMFLPGHWSHIFVGCFIEEIAEEKEPLAPRTKYEMPHQTPNRAPHFCLLACWLVPISRLWVRTGSQITKKVFRDVLNSRVDDRSLRGNEPTVRYLYLAHGKA